MLIKSCLSVLIFFLSTIISAEPLRFSLHKIESGVPGPTLLVIGGIQGDEPGGFTAASMLVTNYKVKSGNLWVVPNLNFESIIKRSRGIHGDMNRKFNFLSNNDPEFDEVQKIKRIIISKDVDVVLNLHDGSGFYKKEYINKMHNPNRWGQSIIIDQENMSSHKYGGLAKIAGNVQEYINARLTNKNKFFYVKNTNTKDGDIEMEKSLTYFSIKNNQPAFAIEASKSVLTHERTFYHLLAVEGFMNEIGVKFRRNFEMTLNNVEKQIGNNLKISLYDNRINLNVEKARRYLNYIPLKKHSALEYKKNNPLIAIVSKNKTLKVRYGNRYVTSLKPQYFDYDYDLNSITIEVDGINKEINIGDKIYVEKSFRVLADNNYRVNVIGFAKHGVTSENDLLIERKNIEPRFSVDRNEKIFRVELYNGKKFSGMILVNFIDENKNHPVSMNSATPNQMSSKL
ncbi:MAG: succinylglutamate desuccinylase/aspartoacylase family protein [Gammaproteobacteria bacterium]|nr:succinylglutamate desuccinylase/aspartoacylase family protein [Gammaproteobacteria bacterium]